MHYADGEKRYIIQPVGLKVGQKIMSGPEADILVGNALPLKNIPLGTIVHNIELRPGKGAQMARSAGAQVNLIAKEGDYALLKLPSGETRKVLVECMATIGQVGNTDHENVTIGKAGRNRWKGIRPANRGVSMNPVDHPHGGGEGKTSGGRHPVTPWGQPTRGYKTRNNKRTDVFIVSAATRASKQCTSGGASFDRMQQGQNQVSALLRDSSYSAPNAPDWSHTCHALQRRVRSSTRHLMTKIDVMNADQREEGHAHLVAPLDHLPGHGRPHHRRA